MSLEWPLEQQVARAAELIEQEERQPERLIYLSFASTTRHLGSCVVRARGTVTAVKRAHELGINPGGQVVAMEVPPEAADLLPLDQLLTKAEVESYTRAA